MTPSTLGTFLTEVSTLGLPKTYSCKHVLDHGEDPKDPRFGKYICPDGQDVIGIWDDYDGDASTRTVQWQCGEIIILLRYFILFYYGTL